MRSFPEAMEGGLYKWRPKITKRGPKGMNKASWDHPKVQEVGLEINRGLFPRRRKMLSGSFQKCAGGLPALMEGPLASFAGPSEPKPVLATATCLEGSEGFRFLWLELF